MRSFIKFTLLMILASISAVSYADDSKYCPESQNIHSTQGLGQLLVQGYNFEGQLFAKSMKTGHGAYEEPSIWMDNFNFTHSSYDAATKTLSCTYSAMHHIYGESDTPTWITISNTGVY